jgi:hypothetical protein
MDLKFLFDIKYVQTTSLERELGCTPYGCMVARMRERKKMAGALFDHAVVAEL